MKIHKHRYNLIAQRTILCTNVNSYLCKCGKEKKEFQMFGGKVIKIHPDFYKKQGKDLLEKNDSK